jgi:outer membrane receptor protein involved in Fe transport
VGGDARWDHIGQVGIFRVANGVVTGTIRNDRVDEVSGGLYGEGEWHVTPALRLVLGLRGDVIGYDVRSDLAANSGKGSAGMVSPKAALAWQVGKGVELYANYGEGFHSTTCAGRRSRLIRPAAPGAAWGDGQIAWGRVGRADRARAVDRLAGGFLARSGFRTGLRGRRGVTEPNAATRRFGTELSLFWKPVDGLTIDGSLAYTHARFRGVDADAVFIPNATPLVLAGGVSGRITSRLTATLRLRHFASAPLTEDNLHRSSSTTLVNAGAYWDIGRWRISADMMNLFNARDPDISYWYASRLPGEPAGGVEDRHIHPVEPRQVRATLRYSL